MSRLGETGQRIVGEFPGGRERGVAGVGLVEPGLRGRAIGIGQRLQFAARLGEIVAQRSRRNPRDDRAAIIADGIGALDAYELGGTRLEAIDDAGAAGLRLRRRRELSRRRHLF